MLRQGARVKMPPLLLSKAEDTESFSTEGESDDWQMEAIQEQFEVFESLKVPYQKIVVQGNFQLFTAALNVMRKHLRLSNEYNVSTISGCSEKFVSTVLNLCKVTKKNDIEFSFVVIVTNQNVYSKGLCKIPIFIVKLGPWSFFIDINNYKPFDSWNAFMQENGLPACKFCFPVDGRYNVGGKLKIDFASSSSVATQSLVKTSMLTNVVGKVVDSGEIAITFLIKVAPICFKVVSQLLPVAAGFISKLSTQRKAFNKLGLLLHEFKAGMTPITDIMMRACTILIPLAKFILSHVTAAWVDVKRVLPKAYKDLQEMFPKFFASASPSSEHEFLAITEGIDSKMDKIKNEAKAKIAVAKELTSGPVNADVSNRTYNQEIFSNSITDCALSGECGGKPFGETTTKILTIVKEAAEDQNFESLYECKDMLESVSAYVFDEYRIKINSYSKAITAANSAAADGKCDIDKFNESYGIVGDPEEHIMQEVLQSCLKTLRCKYIVKEKVKDLKEHSQIVLIPLWKKHSDADPVGVYRCIGVRGSGTISAPELLSVLQKNFGNVNEKSFVISNLDCVTCIYSDQIAVLLQQTIDEENTSTGVVFVGKWQ